MATLVSFDDDDLRRNFRDYLKFCRTVTKEAIDRMESINNAHPGSADQRVHAEVFEKEAKPRVERVARAIYSTILSYNKNPQDWQALTREDILEAQLLLDEITDMLRKSGAVVNYSRDPATY